MEDSWIRRQGPQEVLPADQAGQGDGIGIEVGADGIIDVEFAFLLQLQEDSGGHGLGIAGPMPPTVEIDRIVRPGQAAHALPAASVRKDHGCTQTVESHRDSGGIQFRLQFCSQNRTDLGMNIN